MLLSQNFSIGFFVTVAICILLIVAIILTIRKIIKDKKEGKGCGGACNGCEYYNTCKKREE